MSSRVDLHTIHHNPIRAPILADFSVHKIGDGNEVFAREDQVLTDVAPNHWVACFNLEQAEQINDYQVFSR